ncbi:MAG TPA: TIGR04282 family arsenosugar biosynthesis glycosyltransferase [Anaerolineales bacterium]|nr:TIGR04282 family arsenosugar biosynthesis glycosyltransferase [Anaerolineales bacterium]
MPAENTLLVAAKQPAPGQTKTRLSPPLSPLHASELYECFLRDTLDAMRKVAGVQRVIGFLPDDAQEYFNQLAPDMQLVRQRGASLGERLDNLLTGVLQGGSQRAVVMDSDSPTLPIDYISRAFELLADADMVMGPTRDGGYYLIGLKRPQPYLLRQVQMSTSHVLGDTLALADSCGLSVSLLPTWYDVDTVADLHQLADEVAGLNGRGVPNATREWLLQTDWRPQKA